MVELFQEWGGFIFVFAAVAMAIVFPGMGSARGVGIVGQAGAGVLAEDPSKFSKVLILEVLPGTQGLYGFLTAIILLALSGVLGGAEDLAIPVGTGIDYFLAVLPISIVGYFSAIHQAKTAAAGMGVVAKKPEDSTKAVVLAAMVETYAVFSLLVSLLAIIRVK